MQNAKDMAVQVKAALQLMLGKALDPFNARLKKLEEAPAPKDGQPGKDGADGKSLLTGEGPPLFAGKTGDTYLDAATGDLYRCD